MSLIKKLSAAATARKLRFAVLRPIDKTRVPSREQFQKAVYEGMPSDQFQKMMSDELAEGAIFVGCAKPGCRMLFNLDGTPTGQSMEPGDVLDLIEDFKWRCQTGVYRRIPGDVTVCGFHPAPERNVNVFDDMKKLYAVAEKFATDAVDSQIDEARANIARQQRKIRQWKAQKKFFKALVAELSKPPKPFKMKPLTRKQRKELEKMRRMAIPTGAVAVPVTTQ